MGLEAENVSALLMVSTKQVGGTYANDDVGEQLQMAPMPQRLRGYPGDVASGPAFGVQGQLLAPMVQGGHAP